ncbi:uncharacterized protein K441DRAFT_222511 [Cenococcum geophilum 1.58]|uniref:uncharacterized protein n=1 Tax=Cenococcum geophilum 1.58 TaxID=794803 RepID=UPI00358F17BE|nr:hypothetical protein K441DRAFT_222511 [Cenococcum geophilum 1.58]
MLNICSLPVLYKVGCARYLCMLSICFTYATHIQTPFYRKIGCTRYMYKLSICSAYAPRTSRLATATRPRSLRAGVHLL